MPSSNSAAVKGGRCIPEKLLIALLADEDAVFLKCRGRQNPAPHLDAGHANPEAVGLGQRRTLVHHLLQDLLIHAELPQELIAQVPAYAVR